MTSDDVGRHLLKRSCLTVYLRLARLYTIYLCGCVLLFKPIQPQFIIRLVGVLTYNLTMIRPHPREGSSLSGAVSNGGSGGIYEKNCDLINNEKTVEVNPVRIRKHPRP
jgi:hypothetical protein